MALLMRTVNGALMRPNEGRGPVGFGKLSQPGALTLEQQ
jgi:hypothetical protein